jgi:hypothetical protein
MNRITQVVKLHLRNKWSWFVIPWLIVVANFLINLVIAMSLNGDETINTGAIASIFVYTFIVGTITIKDTFPFALGLSIRRKDYFLGTALTALLVNCFSTIVLVVMSAIEEATNGWGVRLHLFKIEFMNDYSVISMIGIYLLLLLNLFFFGFALSSLHRRFGSSGMYVFFATLLILGTVGSYIFTHFGLWQGVPDWFIHHYQELFWWVMCLVVVYLAAAYGFLRRATV